MASQCSGLTFVELAPACIVCCFANILKRIWACTNVDHERRDHHELLRRGQAKIAKPVLSVKDPKRDGVQGFFVLRTVETVLCGAIGISFSFRGDQVKDQWSRRG